MTHDTIVIRAPAGTKARWVRQSQQTGQKLSDWIIQRIEAPMTKLFGITIPPEVKFSDLKMARNPETGDVSFDWTPIKRVCAASGIDVTLLGESEDNLAALLTAWYRHHLIAGGDADPVYADLIGEVQAEDAAGQRFSHAPGKA